MSDAPALPQAYNVILTSAEIDVIGKALGDVPLKEGLTVWLSLKAQVAKQQADFVGANVSKQSSENAPDSMGPVDDDTVNNSAG